MIRVGRYAGVIARQLGWDEAAVEVLEQAAQLHDVGKIGIPDAILDQAGQAYRPKNSRSMQKHCGFGKSVFESLSDRNGPHFRRHTELGDRILLGCGSPVLDMAARIA